MTNITHTIDISPEIVKLVESRLREELSKDIEEAHKKVIDEFENKKGGIISGVLVQAVREIDVNIIGDRITFTVRTPSK